jgi:hypothetical protein
VPNLIALIALAPVVVRLTRDGLVTALDPAGVKAQPRPS